MRVAEYRGAVRADVIDKAITVLIENERAFAARDKGGCLADRFPRANRRIDGARNFFYGTIKESRRFFLNRQSLKQAAGSSRVIVRIRRSRA
jgi:hypothetical protein